MACSTCGHSRHTDEGCRTYTAGQGWCQCKELPGATAHGVTTIVPGAALKRMHLQETRAFVEKAKKGAGKPAPWVQREMGTARSDS